MRISPLAIVIIAAVVIIGGSIITYILIIEAPGGGGARSGRPDGAPAAQPPKPRPNVFEDTEPRALPSLVDPGDGSSYSGDRNSTSSPQSSSQKTSPTTKPTQTSQTTQTIGGEIIKPLPSLQDPD
jgi:hypothetical protein